MELSYTAQEGGRLSRVLRVEMGLSEGLINRLKWSGALWVAGMPRHTDYQVLPGDTVTVRLEEPAPEYPAEDGALSVLYEDDWLLAVDKPSGMLIHPSRARNTGTLANLVAGYYRRTGEKSAFHPLTRLDRDTFGIVLLAKNAYACARIQDAGFQKTYEALSCGGPKEDAGFIDAPIARKSLPSLLREIRPDGKKSVTRYRLVRRGSPVCKLSLEPVTGRTHQLRLHCAYMGFPILGDPQYGSERSAAFSAALGLKTQMLLAKRLEFTHPVTGEPMALESGYRL